MITEKLLRDWGACWSEDRIADYLAGRTGISPCDVASDEAIDLEDRLWVLCRALWHRSENAARVFAIDSAALVSCLAGDERDQAEHARLVADLKRIYSLPVVERAAELAARATAWASARNAAMASARNAAMAATWDAARNVARNAAWNAAMAATWDAAMDAARIAAMAAAWAATWDAARAATWDAARDVELRKAIDRALMALGGDADGWTS